MQFEYIGQLADFAKSAASMGTLVVFRLWNKGVDEGKNEFALNVLKEAMPEAEFYIYPLSPAFITQGGPGCVAIQYNKL